MNRKSLWLLHGVVAVSMSYSAFGQDGEADPTAGLSLRAPGPGDAGLTLGVDVPEPRKSLGDRIEECTTLINEGRRLEALDRINEIADEYPAHKQVLMTRTVLLMKNYKFREAADLFDVLIERFPQDAALLNNAAWLYATADEPGVRNGEKAVTLAKKALLTAPLNYHIWSTVSEGYYISGNFEKALQAAQEAMRLAAKEKAASENLREYRSQTMKNMKALETFSLVD